LKTTVSILIIIVFITTVAKGQVEKSPTVTFLNKRGYTFKGSSVVDTTAERTHKWPDTLYYNTVYKARLMGSPTIPISFSKIELSDGKYQVSPSISLGYGYTWFFGSFIFNESDKITVDPSFFFGIIADVGLQNDFSLKKLGSVFTGAFIGFASFSLFGGYDYITGSPVIGIGGRIDLYTFYQSSLRPIGKVTEMRKHKKAAQPIEDE
jgi:hypothetical protein